MENFDDLQEQLNPGALAGAFASIQEQIDVSAPAPGAFPTSPDAFITALEGVAEQLQAPSTGLPIPMPMPGDAPGLPFGQDTAAALQNSGAEIAELLTESLPRFGAAGAGAVSEVAEAYAEAFEAAAGNIPMPEAPGNGGNNPPAAPGLGVALALENGLDGLGEAVAQSLGRQPDAPNADFGAVYAAETIGGALVGLGEDLRDAAILGANAIEAGAEALAAMAPGGGMGGGMIPAFPGEAMLIGGINDGFAALTEGFNMGAEALSGTLPDAIAAGIGEGGNAFLAGATELSNAFMDAIGGDTSTTPPAPSGPTAPAIPGLDGLMLPSDPQDAFEGLIADITGNLPPSGTPDFPPQELVDLFEQGVDQFMDLIPSGGTPEFPPQELTALAGQFESGISSAASQFELLLGGLQNLQPA